MKMERFLLQEKHQVGYRSQFQSYQYYATLEEAKAGKQNAIQSRGKAIREFEYRVLDRETKKIVG